MTSPNQIFDRPLLNRRKARAAADIGQFDFLLKRVAEDLALRVSAMIRDFPLALNLGAWHGPLTHALSQLKNVGTVISAETCLPLLIQCPPPRVLCDEEALPFINDGKRPPFDLIASGLALHLVNDLPGVLVQCRRALKPDGLFLAAILGGATLFELRDCLLQAEDEIEGGASPRVAPFADVRTLGGLLQRAGLALPVTDTDLVTVTYKDMFALLRDLRGMGATNMLTGRRRRPLRRQTLFRAAELYGEKYTGDNGRLVASFEIITMTAWAPHESQQKPLRPGSAQMRLADALGAKEFSTGDQAAPAQPPANPDKRSKTGSKT